MSENKVYTAIGMMSGTSLDGIDVALVETDGKDHCILKDFRCYDYDDETRNQLKKILGRRYQDEDTQLAEKLLTNAHIQAIKQFDHEADIIGFHGQTIIHDPAQKLSWQIGDPQRLADETGVNVVGDMRQADIEAGGQGAPLLPLCHRAFAQTIGKPIAILNLGGVGNLTWLGKERTDILAFDTGPANALMDDVVKEKTGQSYDFDGKLANAGTPQDSILETWLGHDYFKRIPPKSLDRNEWDVAEIYDLGLEDAIATLAMFTVQSVLMGLEQLPGAPNSLYVAGGGRHNKFIMHQLNELLSYPVEPVEAIGWSGDGLEAQGFGYLAVRSLLGLALTLPETTGIPAPATGGKLYSSSAKGALLEAQAR
ncbi:MAG: anhydro-N-acetylmuramic acid kinase [Pseudomonadota bacterium]